MNRFHEPTFDEWLKQQSDTPRRLIPNLSDYYSDETHGTQLPLTLTISILKAKESKNPKG